MSTKLKQQRADVIACDMKVMAFQIISPALN